MSDVTEKAKITYIVQEARDLAGVAGDAWLDVATVEVPVGTKRRTVLKQALARMAVGDQPPRLRALDAESAEVHEPVATTTVEWTL